MADTTHDVKSVTEKRAQFENIDIVRADDAHYNVCNRSHGNGTESDHTYTVDVDPSTGGAVACRCPDYRYRRADAGESCKHMHTVEDHINTVEATSTASAAPDRVAADGGTVVADTPGVETDGERVETDAHTVADELDGKSHYASVTVLSEDEISVRSSHVVLGRLFACARDHGFVVDQVYPTVGDTVLTDVVLKRA